jgi:hypothetical protein
MNLFEKEKWSRLSTALFVGLLLFSILIGVETFYLGKPWIGLIVVIPMVPVGYLMVQCQPWRLPIQFVPGQAEVAKRFIACFLMNNRGLLSQALNESKDNPESNLTPAIDLIIRDQQLEVNERLRQELIAACLLNREFINKKFSYDSVQRRRWLVLGVLLVAFVVWLISQSDSFESFFVSLVIYGGAIFLGRFITGKLFGRTMIKDSENMVNRTIR